MFSFVHQKKMSISIRGQFGDFKKMQILFVLLAKIRKKQSEIKVVKGNQVLSIFKKKKKLGMFMYCG
jgi:hypothetical protein